MKISDIDTEQMEFSEEELDGMVDILTKAEEIKADKALYRLVQKQMRKSVKKIKSVSDLRAKLSEKDLGSMPD